MQNDANVCLCLSKVLPRLFGAFEQGSLTITRTFGGLGLGLNISQTLAKVTISCSLEQTHSDDLVFT